MRRAFLATLVLAALCSAPPPAAGAEAALKVTAKLIKIPSKFPPNEMYDYAYVMQYQVIGGKLDKQKILVAHYNPRIPRNKITDKMRKVVKGKLKRFREGDVHELQIIAKWRKLKKKFGGQVEDRFFSADRKSTRYFCLRADPSKAK